MTDLEKLTAPWPTALLEHWGVLGREAPADIPLLAKHLRVSESLAEYLAGLYGPLAERLTRCLPTRSQPMVLGINGAQGTGKSTAAEVIAHLLELRGFRVCRLSIDDLYLTRAERQSLAEKVHPLLATRGVPGTHDTERGLELLQGLRAARADTQVAIPRFDKAQDDRCAEDDLWEGKPDLIVFEGWCVGARPQPEAALEPPLNALEREDDPDGLWRRHVNRQLERYQPLFACLDHLIMLKAPSFEQVFRWRSEQEAALEKQLKEEGRTGTHLMSAQALQRFIDHYERLTRWILSEMPGRADLVLALNTDHRVERITASGVNTL